MFLFVCQDADSFRGMQSGDAEADQAATNAEGNAQSRKRNRIRFRSDEIRQVDQLKQKQKKTLLVKCDRISV